MGCSSSAVQVDKYDFKEGETATAQAGGTAVQGQVWTCPTCGETNKRARDSCNNCGLAQPQITAKLDETRAAEGLSVGDWVRVTDVEKVLKEQCEASGVACEAE